MGASCELFGVTGNGERMTERVGSPSCSVLAVMLAGRIGVPPGHMTVVFSCDCPEGVMVRSPGLRQLREPADAALIRLAGC